MSERPRTAVIVYGSLLDPDELAELFDGVDERTTPVTVRGFKRIFDQAASWRETAGEQRAVLNVVRSPESQFNGVLVTDLTSAELQAFRERERGYRLVSIDPAKIEPFERNRADDETAAAIETQDLLLTTTGEKRRTDIAPIGSYVERCRAGASEWGEPFLQEFLRTTELLSGETLAARE